MKKLMVSQPMNGKTQEEIISARIDAVKFANDNNYEFVDTLFAEEWFNDENMKKRGVVQKPLYFLAASIEHMSLCHAVYFCKGWESARGCKIEHDIANAYGLKIILERNEK